MFEFNLTPCTLVLHVPWSYMDPGPTWTRSYMDPGPTWTLVLHGPWSYITLKKSLTAQPLRVYYSINGVNGEKNFV